MLLRQNGELVVLRADGEPVWTAEGTGRTLVVTDAGQARLLTGNGDLAWESAAPEPLEDDESDWEVPWGSVPDGRRLRQGQVLRGQTLTSADGAFTLVSSAPRGALSHPHSRWDRLEGRSAGSDGLPGSER